jgi:hypothetical protein
MTKAFDLASFVPAATPAVGNTVQVAALGPPETTAWAKGFVEAPINTTLYVRSNQTWIADPVQADAPDASSYARQKGAWVPLSATAGPPEAPNNGVAYGRMNLGWTPVVPIAGATMTGMLTLAGPPVNPLDAATKAYADTGDATTLASAKSYTDSAILAANIDCGTY